MVTFTKDCGRHFQSAAKAGYITLKAEGSCIGSADKKRLNYKERIFSEFSVNPEQRSGHRPRGGSYAEGPRHSALLDLLQQVLTREKEERDGKSGAVTKSCWVHLCGLINVSEWADY